MDPFSYVQQCTTGYVQEAKPPFSQMSTTFDGKAKRVHLEISSTQGSDSALYYCALQPTVMGAQSTLHTNLTATGGGAIHLLAPFLCYGKPAFLILQILTGCFNVKNHS